MQMAWRGLLKGSGSSARGQSNEDCFERSQPVFGSRCRSPLEATPAASLTPNDPVALLERAFSFAVLALLLLWGGVLLHGVVLYLVAWEAVERAGGIPVQYESRRERHTAVGAGCTDLFRWAPGRTARPAAPHIVTCVGHVPENGLGIVGAGTAARRSS